MSNSNVNSKSFSISSRTLDMRTQKGSFQLAAHCYTPSSQFEDDSEQGDKPAATPNVPGYVLTLVKGAEFPKEHWEPVISRLFDIQSDMQYASIATGVPTPTPIREVWILDYPDDQALGTPDYADTLATFQKNMLAGSSETSYTEADKFVLIAHSIGCLEALLSSAMISKPDALPRPALHSLIMCEPILSYDAERRRIRQNAFVNSASAYIQSSRVEKAYKRIIDDSSHATTQLKRISRLIPVHAVFGSVEDVLSMEDKKSLVDSCSLASVSKVEGVGHWIPQSPQKTAEILFNILQRSGGLKLAKSGNVDALLSKL
ncbi:hypothetical protein VKT23_001221 [Stygiomarasmius scandens]|uniref:AB hydrolase-1 domain-containing protein n=1 Tax=Marasmiellus scandens TaxID=2682957 RepID=A0ABR1K9N6_9AGAR